MTDQRGAALIDVVAACGLCFVLAGFAVPVIGGTLDRERTIIGAQFLAGELQRARLDSLKRAQSVAVRVELVGLQTTLRLFADGNGNGVLQRDVDRGIDPPLTPLLRLDDHFQAAAVGQRLERRRSVLERKTLGDERCELDLAKRRHLNGAREILAAHPPAEHEGQLLAPGCRGNERRAVV